MVADMDNKTELFIDKYKSLESLIDAEYDLPNDESAVSYILRKPEYRSVKSELDYCRQVRNLLSHNPKIDRRYSVEPSDAMIALLEQTIERIRNPQRAKHILIPIAKVSCRTMDNFVLPAMREMNEKVYTHIPILRDGIVEGVFSENTLLSYLSDDEIVSIDGSVKFADIAEYLPLEKHRSEFFRFIDADMLVSKIADEFADAVKNQDRIGLMFVTANGKKTEKLLGIISPWDVAGIHC